MVASDRVTDGVQGRGGKGMRGAGVREDDSIEEVQQVTDHQCLLFFTSDGLAYGLKAYQIPEASRTASGISFSSVSSRCCHPPPLT